MPVTQYVLTDQWSVTINSVACAVRSFKPKEEAKEISVTNSKSAGSYEARGGRVKWSGSMDILIDAQTAERTVVGIKARSILPVTVKRANNDLGFSFSVVILTYEFSLDEDDVLVATVNWVATGPITDLTAVFVYP